jgi:hypothetical protein
MVETSNPSPDTTSGQLLLSIGNLSITAARGLTLQSGSLLAVLELSIGGVGHDCSLTRSEVSGHDRAAEANRAVQVRLSTLFIIYVIFLS